MSDDWYFYGATFAFGKVDGSYSRTWTVSEDQFKVFSNCSGEYPNANYANGNAICITESRWIAESISIYNIQPGDIIYWLNPATNEMGHTAMIVSVDDGRIKYAQHDDDKNDGDLGEYLDTHNDPRDYKCAYIVRIRDEA